MEGLLYLISCPDDRVDMDSFIGFLKQVVTGEMAEVEFPGEEEYAKGVQRFLESFQPGNYAQTARWDRMHCKRRHTADPLVPGCRVQETADTGEETRESYLQRIVQGLEPQCGLSRVVLMPQQVLDDISELADLPSGLALLLLSKQSPSEQICIKRQVAWSEYQTYCQQRDWPRDVVRQHFDDMRLAVVAGVRADMEQCSWDLTEILRIVDERVAVEAGKVAQILEAMHFTGSRQSQSTTERLMREVRSRIDEKSTEIEEDFQSIRVAKMTQLKRDLEQVLSACLQPREDEADCPVGRNSDAVLPDRAKAGKRPIAQPKRLKSRLAAPMQSKPSATKVAKARAGPFLLVRRAVLPNFSQSPTPRPSAQGQSPGVLLTFEQISISESGGSVIAAVKNKTAEAISGVDWMLCASATVKIRENLTVPVGTSTIEVSADLIPCNVKEMSMYFVMDGVEISHRETVCLKEELVERQESPSQKSPEKIPELPVVAEKKMNLPEMDAPNHTCGLKPQAVWHETLFSRHPSTPACVVSLE